MKYVWKLNISNLIFAAHIIAGRHHETVAGANCGVIKQKQKIKFKMKKVKFNGKLFLKKEALSKLNHNQMGNVNGGDGPTFTVDSNVLCHTHRLCVTRLAPCHTRIINQCHITLPFCPTETCQ
jgi:hypothetical protein